MPEIIYVHYVYDPHNKEWFAKIYKSERMFIQANAEEIKPWDAISIPDDAESFVLTHTGSVPITMMVLRTRIQNIVNHSPNKYNVKVEKKILKQLEIYNSVDNDCSLHSLNLPWIKGLVKSKIRV